MRFFGMMLLCLSFSIPAYAFQCVDVFVGKGTSGSEQREGQKPGSSHQQLNPKTVKVLEQLRANKMRDVDRIIGSWNHALRNIHLGRPVRDRGDFALNESDKKALLAALEGRYSQMSLRLLGTIMVFYGEANFNLTQDHVDVWAFYFARQINETQLTTTRVIARPLAQIGRNRFSVPENLLKVIHEFIIDKGESITFSLRDIRSILETFAHDMPNDFVMHVRFRRIFEIKTIDLVKKAYADGVLHLDYMTVLNIYYSMERVRRAPLEIFLDLWVKHESSISDAVMARGTDGDKHKLAVVIRYVDFHLGRNTHDELDDIEFFDGLNDDDDD